MNKRHIFFLLSALTALTVVAVLVANVFEIGDPNFRKWGLAAVLGEIIGLFVMAVRTSFKHQPINVNLSLPEEWHGEFGKLQWDSANCFVLAGDIKEKISLAESDIGPAFTAQLSATFIGNLADHQLVHFELADSQGRSWRVGPFRLHERTRLLKCEVDPDTEPLYD